MAVLRITKKFSFEMAHALHGYDGLCKNIHGHSYHLEVTLKGVPDEQAISSKFGMVLDFAILKEIVNKEIISVFDHALLLSDKTDSNIVKFFSDNYEKVITVSFQPTTENIIVYFADILSRLLPENVLLTRLILSETDSSYAEWRVEDNE